MAAPSAADQANGRGFAQWLNATMRSRGLSQAQLARVVGVADTQVSRWRRGQVVPTVRYLQRIADTLDVPRVSLDRLAGYPVDDPPAGSDGEPAGRDPEREATLHAYSGAFRLLLEQRLPRPLWPAYAAACAALAESMAGAYDEALSRATAGPPPEEPSRPAGFRR